MRLATHLLDELPRDVQRRVRDEVHDRIALVARAEEGELRRELREDARRVAPALALEAEDVGRGELARARALDVVEAGVEEAHPHLFARELELLAERDREPRAKT